jgi:DnaK suppressor protein
MDTIFLSEMKKSFEEKLKFLESTEAPLEAATEGVSGDDVDKLSVEVLNAFNLKLRKRNLAYKQKIKIALEKISNGTYGVCEECEEDIGVDRLLARPTADYCICCKEEKELSEHHHFAGKIATIVKFPVRQHSIEEWETTPDTANLIRMDKIVS